MANAHDLIDELRGPTRSLRQAAPEAWEGFAKLHDAAVGDGVLPARVKELMALVIAVVKRCDGCIAYHAKAAASRRGRQFCGRHTAAPGSQVKGGRGHPWHRSRRTFRRSLSQARDSVDRSVEGASSSPIAKGASRSQPS